MDVVAYLAITGVVWAVTSVRSPSLRATLYSLPIPMSLAILAFDPDPAYGNQLLGVFLLVAFFTSVRTLSLRMSNTLAVAIATAGYVAVTFGIERVVQLPWPLAYAIAPFLWLVGIAMTRALGSDEPEARRSGDPERLAPALVGSALATGVSFALGSWLGGFVVTFPYSGVAVALLWRDNRAAFCQRLARRSLGLYVFLGVFHEVSQSQPVGIALAVAWAGFAIAASLPSVASRVVGRLRQGRAVAGTGSTGR